MPLPQRRLPSTEYRMAENKNTEFCPAGQEAAAHATTRHEETHRAFQRP